MDSPITNILMIRKNREGYAKTTSYRPRDVRIGIDHFDDEMVLDVFARHLYDHVRSSVSPERRSGDDVIGFLLTSDNFERTIMVDEKHARDALVTAVAVRIAREQAEARVRAPAQTPPVTPASSTTSSEDKE